MNSKELTRRILARHGARPDLRLWRNETGLYWTGKPLGNTAEGHLILANPSRVMAGLVKGSADLIGISDDGLFLAVEVKTGKGRVRKKQKEFLALVEKMGGIAGVVRSVGEVDVLLGMPPGDG